MGEKSNRNITENPAVEVKAKQLPGELPPDVPWYRSCRVVLAIISAVGYTFFYVLRIDLSIAIVCMVRDPPTSAASSSSVNYTLLIPDGYSNRTMSSETEEHRRVSSLASIRNDSIAILDRCGGASSGRNKTSSQKEGELEWSKELRSHVMSSFFYGYILTQVPGGWLASRYGGKHVFGIGVLISLIATILVPVAARAHAYWVILLRVIMGLGCGVGFPATHHLYGLWVPPLERSKTLTFSYAGTMLGTVLALIVSGFLCDSDVDNGWPLIFYVYGGLTFVWWVFWNLLVYNSPEEHPRIDPVERNYIMSTIGPSVYESHKEESIPWRKIMTSGPVWSIITAHSCNNWTNYTILVCVPMYMKEVLRFDVKQNGALSALPYVFSYFAAIGSGQLSDFLISRRILSTKATRIWAQSISTTIPAALLVALGFVDCDMRLLAVALLCLTVGINSTCRAGFVINHVDISPRHSGILFGISNTAATIPGILAPTAVGYLTPNGSREEWLTVFYICAGLFLFSTVIYAVFAEGEPQSWSTKQNAAASSMDDGKGSKVTGTTTTMPITNLPSIIVDSTNNAFDDDEDEDDGEDCDDKCRNNWTSDATVTHM